ncbi:hypothetical protein AVEN_246507-1 [Araneus ventricosus]|uniref:Uncharacterized protein n=1 Tax=Araneus ventricosus TaxID=182803 RepID=A0A4Y2MD89_ARAVE|nr:hypothetical protein AVEN_246507-1 [Araneus ventricosus]
MANKDLNFSIRARLNTLDIFVQPQKFQGYEFPEGYMREILCLRTEQVLPAVFIPLISVRRRTCSALCREHRLWVKNKWQIFLFTNEFQLNLNTDYRCTLIWYEPGARFLATNIQKEITMAVEV